MYTIEKQVSMTKKGHNNRQRTNPGHLEEEEGKIDSHSAARTHLKKNNQLPILKQGYCKTRKETKILFS